MSTSLGTRFVWIVIGPTCSGKSECGEFLAQKGCTWIEASRWLVHHVPLSQPAEVRRRSVDAFFESRGRDFIARSILAEVQAAASSVRLPTVITGFRFTEEIDVFRQAARVSLLALYSPARTRYTRAADRGRADLPANFAEFLRASAWEYSLGLASLIAQADDIVENDGSVSELQEKLDALLRESLNG